MAISLKAARVNANLTQAEVANLLNISKSTINNYENYKKSPNIARAKELAKLYGMEVDEIVWQEE